MWQYQSGTGSGLEERWQLDAQQDLATLGAAFAPSPLTSATAWNANTAAFHPVQPATTKGSPCSVASLRGQPCRSRWQVTSAMSPFRSPGPASRHGSASAAAAACSTPSYQPAHASNMQHSLPQSSSNDHALRHRYGSETQFQPANLDGELFTTFAHRSYGKHTTEVMVCFRSSPQLF